MRAAAANPAEAPVGEDEATMVAAPPLVSKAVTRVTPARTATPMPAAPPAQRSNLPIVAGAAAVILLLLGGGGWWFLLRTPEPSPVVSQGTSIPSQSAATPSTTGQKPVEAPKPEILEVKGPTPQPPAVIASTPTQPPAPATTPTPQLAMVVPQPQPPPPPVVQAPLAPSALPPIQHRQRRLPRCRCQQPPPAAVTQVPVQQPPPPAVTQVPVLPPSPPPPPIVQPSVQQPPPPAIVQQNPPVTPPSVVQPPQQLAAVNPGVLRREIADWANSRPCTVLGGDVGDGGSVTLNGLANSGSVEDLRQGLTSLHRPARSTGG